MREIQATSWQGKQWIVEEGLHVGDRVIVDGLHKIAPGAPVKPMPLPDPGATDRSECCPAQGGARLVISHFFIDRPIFASVLSIVIVVIGLVALRALPIAQFPEITPPVVQVEADYPGANAEIVADSVARPIEVQLPASIICSTTIPPAPTTGTCRSS